MRLSRSRKKSRDLEYDSSESYNFFRAIRSDRVDILEKHFENDKDIRLNFNRHEFPNFIIPCPLIQAIKSKARNALKCLLKHGADPHYICESVKMNSIEYSRRNDMTSYLILMEFQSKNQKE